MVENNSRRLVAGSLKTVRVILVSTSLIVGLMSTATGARAQAVVTEIGSLGGGEGMAFGVNDAGQIVGFSGKASAEPRAFLWQDGIMSDLLGMSSVAQAINQNGDVVGYYPVSGTDHGFLWQRGSLVDLGIRRARALNERGDVVGEVFVSGLTHPVLWTDVSVTDLGLLPGTTECWATAINNRRQIVGSCLTGGVGSPRRAFLWDAGQMQDIGTLGGDFAEARSINDRGQIVGSSTATTIPGLAYYRAFLWERGIMWDLGTLGGAYSSATAITASSAVVGESTLLNGLSHGFLLVRDMTDLGPTGDYSYAAAANNHGAVVGYIGVGAGVRPVLWQ